MNKQNLAKTRSEERKSPRGKFQLLQKNLSLALGGVKDLGPWEGGHPFDVCEVRIPPGKTNWPMHMHSAQWEFFLVQSGNGVVRTQEGETPITEGDYFVHAPGTAHQIINRGQSELVMLVVADNPVSDLIRYPESGKYFLKPSRVSFDKNGRVVEYYEGEE
jgi:uncharacterized cupin superfamily protein